MEPKLLDRKFIFERCYFAGLNVGIDSKKLNNIINKFEYYGMPEDRIGVIMKYIFTLIEEHNKKPYIIQEQLPSYFLHINKENSNYRI